MLAGRGETGDQADHAGRAECADRGELRQRPADCSQQSRALRRKPADCVGEVRGSEHQIREAEERGMALVQQGHQAQQRQGCGFPQPPRLPAEDPGRGRNNQHEAKRCAGGGERHRLPLGDLGSRKPQSLNGPSDQMKAPRIQRQSQGRAGGDQHNCRNSRPPLVARPGYGEQAESGCDLGHAGGEKQQPAGEKTAVQVDPAGKQRRQKKSPAGLPVEKAAQRREQSYHRQHGEQLRADGIAQRDEIDRRCEQHERRPTLERIWSPACQQRPSGGHRRHGEHEKPQTAAARLSVNESEDNFGGDFMVDPGRAGSRP
jgi:hypothetical protein